MAYQDINPSSSMTYNGVVYQIGDIITLKRPELYSDPMSESPSSTTSTICDTNWVIAQFFGSDGFIPRNAVMITCTLPQTDRNWLPDAFIPFSLIGSGGINIATYYIVHYVTEGDVTNMPIDQTKLVQTPLIIYSNVPSRSGYDFIGWENQDEIIDSVGNKRVYRPGDMYTSDNSASMLALWKSKVLSITFDKNSGTDGVNNLPEYTTCNHGSNYTFNTNVPTRYGYSFSGYATSIYGAVVYTVSQIQAGLTIKITESLKLYCAWGRGNYTINYANRLNAFAFPDDQNKLHGINLVLSNIRPNRPGFEFLRWDTTLLGESKSFQPGEVYSYDNDTVLTAVWTTKNYYIFYYLCGGTSGPNTQTKQDSDPITLSSIIPVKEGCKFLGWGTSENNVVVYNPGDTYNMNASLNLYAVWDQLSYRIHYNDANPTTSANVTNMPPTGYVDYYGVYTVPVDNPQLQGYTFTGWSLEEGGRVDYTPGSIITGSDRNIELYAIWSIESHIITFDTGCVDVVTNMPIQFRVAHGGSVVLPTQIPIRNGYQFLYYTASTMNGYIQYYPGVQLSDVLEDIVFKAWWKESYRISYIVDYGEYTDTITDWKDENIPYAIMGTIPHRDGYTFIGWSTTSYGNITYNTGDIYYSNSNLTLYAVWEVEMIYIVYDMDGTYISGNPLPQYVQKKNFGDTITLYEYPPVDTPGYMFYGWKLDRDSTMIDYPVGVINKYNSDINKYVILYPQLEPINYEIRFWKNSDVGINPSIQYLPDNTTSGYHEEYRIPVTRPVREGYIFRGYCYSPVYSEQGMVAPGATITIEGNTDLYCTWEPEQYVFSYQWLNMNNIITTYRESVQYGVEYTFPNTLPTNIPDGMLFNGWSITDGGTILYQPNHTILPKIDMTFYAVMNQMTYVVVYMANGGEYAPITQRKLYGIDLQLTTQYPVREGYVFQGWSTEPDGSKILYLKDSSYMYRDNQSMILYAVWEEKTYQITYDANGGYGVPIFQIKKEGVPLQLTFQTPMKDGYQFIGWSTIKDIDVVAYSPGNMYTLDMDLTLYAIWTVIRYEITYDIYGENADVWVDLKDYNIDYQIRSVIPQWEGHTFRGWSTTSYRGNVEFHPGDWYTLNRDLFLYSIYDTEAFTITYTSAGGYVVLPPSQTKYYGETTILNGTIPHRTGYGFIGYATSESSSEPVYFPGDTYAGNRDLTLWCLWGPNQYVIRYNANGGVNAPEPQTKFYDVKVTLSNIIPVREGHTFKGWSIDGDTISYKPGWTYTMNASIVFYALWDPNYYDVDYLLNGGIMDAPTHQTKKHSENLILCATKPEKDGYDFLGWGLTSDATKVEYESGALYTKNESILLYAVYTPKGFTIEFNTAGFVENMPNPITKYFGSDILLPNTIPIREFYGFLGWTTKEIGTGELTDVEYYPNDYYREETSVVLYAVWKRVTYRYTYNANGGTDAPMTQWKTAGVPITITSFIPVRIGFTFKGWSRSAVYTQVAYNPEDMSIEDADLTLYAVWEISTFTIHFDPNGGGGAPSDITKYYGIQVFIPALIPMRNGYRFVGWANTPDSKYAMYSPGDIYIVDGSVVLYAVWDNIDLWKNNITAYYLTDDYKWVTIKTIRCIDEDNTEHFIEEIYGRPLE